MHLGGRVSVSDPSQLGGLSIAYFPISTRKNIDVRTFPKDQTQSDNVYVKIRVPWQYHGTALQFYRSEDQHLDTLGDV